MNLFKVPGAYIYSGTLQQSLSVDDVVQVRVVEVDVARGQVTVRLVKPE